MKRLFTLFFLAALLPIAAAAQTRTYGDIESKAFVIGLEQYYFGSAGSLGFKVAKQTYEARIEGGSVTLVCPDSSEMLLFKGEGDIMIGIHDFTGNRNPELVVARRGDGILEAEVFQLGGRALSIGRIGAAGEDVSEIRVFRQAFTIKNHKSGAMYSWTWHKTKFDFKASDGSSDPTPEKAVPAENAE